MRKLAMITLLGASLMLSACSKRGIYDNIQHNRRLDCQDVPAAEYDNCIDSTRKSFEEYQREREADKQAG